MSRWIVAFYEQLVNIALWGWVVSGGVLGLVLGMTFRLSAFSTLVAIVAGAAMAFFFAAILFGAALILGEILREVTALRRMAAEMGARPAVAVPYAGASPSAMPGPSAGGQPVSARPAAPAPMARAEPVVEEAPVQDVSSLPEALLIMSRQYVDPTTGKRVKALTVYRGAIRAMRNALRIDFEDGGIELRNGGITRRFSSVDYLLAAERNEGAA
jgi:hypothetical protein